MNPQPQGHDLGFLEQLGDMTDAAKTRIEELIFSVW